MASQNRYDEEFKKSLVDLYHNGRTQASIIKDFGGSQTALSRWVKQYSTVKTVDGDLMTAQQVKQMQKRLAELEEENLILKKRLPSSRHTPGKTERGPQTPLSA